MSTPRVLVNMRSTNLPVPNNLNVTGRGLTPPTPRASTPPSPEDAPMVSIANSSHDSLSDEDTMATNEEFTVLDGVREMNHILVRQIETLRLKIKVDEKNYDQEKARLVLTKENELRVKEDEIEELRESVNTRDDAIQRLTKAGAEKDRTIQTKCAEIEELKGMVRQTKEYAQKMQKQVGQAKQQRKRLEADPLYQQQNDEIRKLTQELETLRDRLATMEGELARALTIIEQQNGKLQSLDQERAALHEKFREDLEKASKAMRQEVERMREVMRQNYDEMRCLRQQNKDMHEDVRAIKEMLKTPRNVEESSSSHVAHQESLTGLQRPIMNSPLPSYGRYTQGQGAAVPPTGPGGMVGSTLTMRRSILDNKRGSSFKAMPNSVLRESTEFSSRANAGKGTGAGNEGVDSSGYYSSVSTARVSGEAGVASRMSFNVTGQGKKNESVNNKPGSKAADGKSLPSICSVKEGVPPISRQPSGRGRPIIRKGSAVLRK